jgi:hypothetical protein
MNEQTVSAGPAEGPGILAVFMIEDRDAHAKVLAAPFDRIKPSAPAASSPRFKR